jgi:LEA14-like dessication related protein
MPESKVRSPRPLRSARVDLPIRALIALVLLVLPGCALFFRAPEVRIVDIRVVEVGLRSGTAEVILEVDNPNRYALEILGLDYRLEVGSTAEDSRWDLLAEGFHSEPLRLRPRTEERIALQLPFRYSALGTALGAWIRGGEVPYRVEGRLRAKGPVGARELPFQARGALRP